MEEEQRDTRGVGQGGTAPTTPTYSYTHLQQLFRQNSEKMGHLAEDVVLPINKRSIKRSEMMPEVETFQLQLTQPYPTPTPAPYGQAVVVIPEGKLQPYKPTCKFPTFMVTVCLVQLGLFYNFSDDTMLLLFGFDPYRRYELWRYVTIMLAHSSASHLWGNIVFQVILGFLLEMVHHWRRIGVIYLASVVGGSLFITIISPQVYGVGASAGVYGLLFAHLSTIILNWNEMDWKCCRLFWLLAYIAYDVSINALVKFVLEIETNTSHAGHIGGAITGFLVAIIVLKNFEKLPWEKKLQKVCGGILIAMVVIITLINIAFPSYYLPAAWNFDYEETYIHHILKAIKESPEDSLVRRVCEMDVACNMILQQYAHNGTIPKEFE